MERKRIEKLVVLLLLGILMPVSLFPFRINADTITNSNVNINYYLESVTEVSSGSYLQTYKVDFIFDQSYLGWISTKMVGTYVSNNTLPTTTSQFTITRAIYVNGSVASTSVSFTTPNTISSGALQSLSQSIQNSSVTPLADLSTLDDILNVLNDINDHISIDILDELQDIVSNTSLANDYLEAIYKMKQFNIPFESLSIVSFYLTQSNFTLYDGYIDNSYVMNYPMFYIPKYKLAFSTYLNSGDSCLIIFASEIKRSDLLTYFNNLNLSGFTYDIQTSNIGRGVNDYLTLYKIKVTNNSNNQNFGVYTTGSFDTSKYIIPILCVNLPFNNISTDFALRFGLSNPFLDNIQTIANGTTQSNTASSSLDQATSQFSDDANDLVTIEESFNNSMNSSLQNVNPTFNMGSSFLTSANWVSQQFNRIVNNTPFASLITFGLTLGLGLLIIGKVRK